MNYIEEASIYVGTSFGVLVAILKSHLFLCFVSRALDLSSFFFFLKNTGYNWDWSKAREHVMFLCSLSKSFSIVWQVVVELVRNSRNLV